MPVHTLYYVIVDQILHRDVDECSDFSSIVEGYNEGMVDLTAGYIQHCIVDQGFDKIKQYDLYRYIGNTTQPAPAYDMYV